MIVMENKLHFNCKWDVHTVRAALGEYLQNHGAELKDYQVEDVEETLRRLRDVEREAAL